MKKAIYHWNNPRPLPPNVEFGASLTVPDQTMSIRTLIDRYRRGMPLDVKVREPQYLDDKNPEFEKMDETTRLEMLKEAKRNVAEIRYKLQNQDRINAENKVKEYEKTIEELKKQIDQNVKNFGVPNETQQVPPV